VKYSLVRLLKLSGEAASVYSIKIDALVLFDVFLEEYRDAHLSEMLGLMRKIKSMTEEIGIIEPHYKPDEGCKAGDNVVDLFDAEEKLMRLYGIRKSKNLIIVGSGGPKTTRTWQEDPKLAREVELMCLISEMLEINLEHGSLKISVDGLTFIGNLGLN